MQYKNLMILYFLDNKMLSMFSIIMIVFKFKQKLPSCMAGKKHCISDDNITTCREMPFDVNEARMTYFYVHGRK